MKTGRLFVIFLILAPLSLGLLRLASAVATDVVVTSQPNDANVNDSEPSVAVSPINPKLVLVGSIDVSQSCISYLISIDGVSTFHSLSIHHLTSVIAIH